MICSLLPISMEEKQKLLEINDIVLRIKSTIAHMDNIICVYHFYLINQKNTEDISIKFNQGPINMIQGNTNNNAKNPKLDRLTKIEELINTKKLSEEAKTIALNELNRLKSMDQRMSEYDVVINYLDVLLSLPWDTVTQDPTDLAKCEVKLNLIKIKETLNRDHFGLEKIKTRILEFISHTSKRNSIKLSI